jgi:hypothetical protein
MWPIVDRSGCDMRLRRHFLVGNNGLRGGGRQQCKPRLRHHPTLSPTIPLLPRGRERFFLYSMMLANNTLITRHQTLYAAEIIQSADIVLSTLAKLNHKHRSYKPIKVELRRRPTKVQLERLKPKSSDVTNRRRFVPQGIVFTRPELFRAFLRYHV